MKINAVISPHIINKKRFIKNNRQLFSFITIAFALVAGTILYIFFEDYIGKEIAVCFEEFGSDLSSKKALDIFSGILISNLPYVIFTVILGTSPIGYHLILFINFIRVTGLGALSAFLYSSFGLKGIEYALLVFFPGKYIYLLSVMMLISFSLDNSFNVKELIKGELRPESDKTDYLIRIIIVILSFVLSALIDCFFIMNFSSLFSFS